MEKKNDSSYISVSTQKERMDELVIFLRQGIELKKFNDEKALFGSGFAMRVMWLDEEKKRLCVTPEGPHDPKTKLNLYPKGVHLKDITEIRCGLNAKALAIRHFEDMNEMELRTFTIIGSERFLQFNLSLFEGRKW